MTRPDPFVPAEPGAWQTDLKLVSHEAWHCAAALLFDVVVREVRVDRPGVDLGVGGCTWVVVHGERWRNAAACLAPSIIGGTVPARPDPFDSDPDVAQASVHFMLSDPPRPEWSTLIEMTRELLLSPFGRRLIKTISSALLEAGALSADAVAQLTADAEAFGKASSGELLEGDRVSDPGVHPAAAVN